MNHALSDIQDRRAILDRVAQRFARLYPQSAARCMQRLRLRLQPFNDQVEAAGVARWDHRTNVLITYGDSIRHNGEVPLQTLSGFLNKHLADIVDHVHILPFTPYSSDDGFSVIDYVSVNPALGRWDDIEAIGGRFRLMFDLVLNHCSRHSGWFRDYVAGVAPGLHYFVEVTPGEDLSQVVRPRSSPLLTQIETRLGTRWVWTTFSDDQIDLNFANADVLFEFIDILLYYLRRGVSIIRLDAIAYLWKQIGTNCIHRPQTHEVVKLLRDVLELVAPYAIVLTETNVPHEENISYFGAGDEAHMVYNFTLPPLLLHAMVSGNARHLTQWAATLKPPPPGCSYLNFTASHDGIGVRPLEGILTTEEIGNLVQHVRALGGFVNEKANADGTTSPYEMNITYFDAMGRPEVDDLDRKVDRFVCSQAVALALRGVPAVYIHSLLGTPNDVAGVQRLGYNRAINRHKWDRDLLQQRLDDATTPQARVFRRMKELLAIRAKQPAFHPDAPQQVLDLDPRIFALQRTSLDEKQIIICLHNLSGKQIRLSEQTLAPHFNTASGGHNLITNRTHKASQTTLQPYQVCWLTNQMQRGA